MSAKTCKSIKKKSTAKARSRALLAPGEAAVLLARLGASWKIHDNTLVGEWRFADFAAVAVLVRAVVRLSIRACHHPQVEFGYCSCRIVYITHSAGGLSALDFYCADCINKLTAPR